jgi:hypothetical protein
MFAGPYFFLAIVVGLILAVGFQLLLTNLSLAAGVSALRFGPETREEEATTTTRRTGTFGERARRLTGSVGIWALVSASVALFFASWLAVELSLTISMLVGAILGLVIWALFYLVMTSFSLGAMGSLVGALFRNISGGFRTVWESLTRFFARSEEARAADLATRVTRAVKDELFRGVRLERVRGAIDDYVRQLAPARIDPSAVRKEVEKLFDETEIRAIATHEGEPLVSREAVIGMLHTRPSLRPTDIQAVAQGVDEALKVIKDEAFSGKDRVSLVTDTALRLTGRSREEAVATRAKVEEWLRATGKEELDPDGIKRDLDRLLVEPSVGLVALRERLGMIDRETVEAVLSQRADISPDEAHRIVDTVERWVKSIATRVDTLGGAVTTGAPAIKERVTAKVRAYLESLQRPELDYEGIRADLERLLEEPGAGAEALAERARSVDRDTVKAILASRRDLTEQDAERILQQVEAARDSVMRKVRVVRDEVERRLLTARDQAWRQAEEARKTAATAAWWGVATAVVSAIAAILGGMLAVSA